MHDVVLDHLTLDRSSKEAANYGLPPAFRIMSHIAHMTIFL